MESSTAKRERKIKMESPTETIAERPHVSIAQVIAERLAFIERNQTKSAETLFTALKLVETSVTTKISEAVQSLVQRITNLEETCSTHFQMTVISSLQRDVRERMRELDLHWNLEKEIADADNCLLARQLLNEMKRFQKKPRNSKKLIAEAIRLNLMKEKWLYDQTEQAHYKEVKLQSPNKPLRRSVGESRADGLSLGLEADEFAGNAVKCKNKAKIETPFLTASNKLGGVVKPSVAISKSSLMKKPESNGKVEKLKRKQTATAENVTKCKKGKRKLNSKAVGSWANKSCSGIQNDKQKYGIKTDDSSLIKAAELNKKTHKTKNNSKTNVGKIKSIKSVELHDTEKLKQKSRAVLKSSLAKIGESGGKADKNKPKTQPFIRSSATYNSVREAVNAADVLREIDFRHKVEILNLERSLIEKARGKESALDSLNPSWQTSSPYLEREKKRKRENKRDECDDLLKRGKKCKRK